MHVTNDDLCPFCSCADNLIQILNNCPRLLSLFKWPDYFIHNIFEELDVFRNKSGFMVSFAYMTLIYIA